MTLFKFLRFFSEQVLKNNYLMIGMDGSEATDGSDWFCYHASSPCIFPAGFCSENGLTLSKPRGLFSPSQSKL